MGSDEGCDCVDGATRPCGPTTEVGECAFGTQRCIDGGWAECAKSHRGTWLAWDASRPRTGASYSARGGSIAPFEAAGPEAGPRIQVRTSPFPPGAAACGKTAAARAR